jgi:AcrR family transcriptional regulator
MNDVATDERIVETAIRLFAQRGFHGTSIRQITREAGVNLGAVTYHFGGKRGLYARALERCIGPVADRVVERAGAGAGPPLARLEGVVEVFFDYLGERPELPQLMLQELVAGRLPPAGALRSIRRVLETVGSLIAEGQASGEVRAGDPVLMAVSVVSQPLHLALTSRVVSGSDPHEPTVRGRLLEHVRAFIATGLRPAVVAPASGPVAGPVRRAGGGHSAGSGEAV